MSNITAKMVAELREVTGLGMMECKKALVEAEGVMAKAEELLRIKSGAKANKVAGRIAADGAIAVFISNDAKNGALVEVNCETDFVAKDANFLDFTNSVAKAVVDNKVDSIEDLANVKLADCKTVEETRKEIIAKIGENISVRRLKYFSTNGVLANYLHGKKIGVIVDLAQGDSDLGRDLAMHIAASKPVCVSANEVPSEKIEAERNIFEQQAAQSGKAPEIVSKMVEGRINKYLAEITLLGQQFVKNPDMTVEKLLASKNAKVNSFTMFVVGEGIEKKVVDFQAEVAEAAAVANK